MPAVIFLESLTFLNAISGNWSDTNLLFLLTNSKKFIAGEPIKPATKRFLGLVYNSIGVPTCSTIPSFNTTILSAKVMASTWSCVT